MLTIAANTAAQPPQQHNNLKLDTLPDIDMTTLSQSELLALSRISLPSLHDVVSPKLDRSVFNESAGSRRQTYSRPRHPSSAAAPPPSSAHRHRVAGLLPTPKPATPGDDPERIENKSIVGYLKKFVEENPSFSESELHAVLPAAEVVYREVRDEGVAALRVGFGGGEMAKKKKKRGRKAKGKTRLVEGVMLEILNRDGVDVDLERLEGLEDPYGLELRRRTQGVESEEGLLAFLRDLGGQWVSRRRKRKIVDASEFGDFLPVGWKLLLGLQRREFRASINCRRYVSPSGQHFVSCKQVASYLKSYFQQNNCQEEAIMDTEIQREGIARNDGPIRSIEPNAVLPALVFDNENSPVPTLLQLEHLTEVKIQDLFLCHKCTGMHFDNKDAYLQHLSSVHQKTKKRYKLGSSVGNGVIIRDDGKFECQFCHKVFLERHRYNGHVGIHVRNYGREVEKSGGQLTISRRDQLSTMDELPPSFSKMDALIEIAQNSIIENSVVGPSSESDGFVSPNGIPVAIDDQELSFGSPSEAEDESMIDMDIVDPDMNHKKCESAEIDENMEGIGNDENLVAINLNTCLDGAPTILYTEEQRGNASETTCRMNSVGLAALASEKQPSDGQKMDFDGNLIDQSGNHVSTDKKSDEKIVNSSLVDGKSDEVDNIKNRELHADSGNDNGGVACTAMLKLVQRSAVENTVQCRIPETVSLQGGEEYSAFDQKRQNAAAFEELSLDEIDNLKFSFAAGQESFSVSEVPIDLANNVQIEGGFTNPVQLEAEDVTENIKVNCELTTSCVWCGVEFNHESDETEVPSGSVGYMCPICKAKISGQLDTLDTGSPINPHNL